MTETGEKFSSEHGYALSIDELDGVKELVGQGLKIITICNHGIGRSFALAELFSEMGFPSMFIEGGFETISDLSSKEMSEVVSKLALVPHIFVTLTEQEIGAFSDSINAINLGREEKLFVHNSKFDEFPRLMKKLMSEK
jgi:hypothetical protein